METKTPIELLKIFLNFKHNDNYIGYDYDNEIKVHYFKFNDIIYSSQIVYIVSLTLKFHLITIDNNIDVQSNSNLFISISSQTIKVITNNNFTLNLESAIYVEIGDNITLFTRESDMVNFIGIAKIINIKKFNQI
jgi:hypothetical protein